MGKITEKLSYPFVFVGRSISVLLGNKDTPSEDQEEQPAEEELAALEQERDRAQKKTTKTQKVVSYFEPEDGHFIRVFAPLHKMTRSGMYIGKKTIYQVNSDYPLNEYTVWSEDGTFALVLMFIYKRKFYPLPAENKFDPDGIHVSTPQLDLAQLQKRVYEDPKIKKFKAEITDLKTQIEFLMGVRQSTALCLSEATEPTRKKVVINRNVELEKRKILIRRKE